MNALHPRPPLKGLFNVPAPAKLNLFLHVTGRRADGYHLLQSVFMLLDWCDTLHFELRRDGGISREDLNPTGSLALPAQDLCVRAARLLQQHTACPLGVHIGLEKHLPAEAGLGGGSSDAASCLLALNRLWGLGLNRRELAALGVQLGADVPFFLGGQNAWVEGIGEHIQPLALDAAQFVVVKPPVGASTQAIFQHPALKRDTKPATIFGFAAHAATQQNASSSRHTVQSILDMGHNDLQAVVEVLCPDVLNGMQWLQSQGLSARMTGSGTAVFAPIPQTVDQQSWSPVSVPGNWLVKICKNMDVHPLFDWCSG
ncbi:MAG: 4-(cytidine 5-diphospho)-2-C-methyl-D-erythritol kinase [Pseudomonadota bacterium]|jgi:4-diphosphocytidyl-2-C-methyl-D-erythritol kinase